MWGSKKLWGLFCFGLVVLSGLFSQASPSGDLITVKRADLLAIKAQVLELQKDLETAKAQLKIAKSQLTQAQTQLAEALSWQKQSEENWTTSLNKAQEQIQQEKLLNRILAGSGWAVALGEGFALLRK